MIISVMNIFMLFIGKLHASLLFISSSIQYITFLILYCIRFSVLIMLLYSKFWELDQDHDGYIDIHDLLQYDDYSLTQKICERIMAGAGRQLLSTESGKMNYLDFIIFLISEVDKSSDISLDYWFNCVDLDGDGLITTFEIEYFFEEQKQRIQALSQEVITFPDILCQLIDGVKKPLRTGQQNLNSISTRSPKAAKAVLSSATASAVTVLSTSPPALSLTTPASPVTPTRHYMRSTRAIGVEEMESDGIFFKKDLRDSHMAPTFFNTLFNLSMHNY